VALFVNAKLPIAVFCPSPEILKPKDDSQKARLLLIFPLPRPTLIPLIVASAVVTRFPLAPERRNDSILFRLNTRSWLLVVPINCPRVIVFPANPHPDVAADCQLALPSASVVSTYPEVAPDEIRIFWNAPVHATSSL
jgi:hypothetical protein